VFWVGAAAERQGVTEPNVMERIRRRIMAVAIATSLGFVGCADDPEGPGDRSDQFEGILETDFNCNIIGGDTTDFLPRPEGDIDTTVVPPVIGGPTNYSLAYACPNPNTVGWTTFIHWQIPQTDSVWIFLFDEPGAEPVDTLYNRRAPAGSFAIIWQPDAPGIFRIRMYTESGFTSYGDVLINDRAP